MPRIEYPQRLKLAQLPTPLQPLRRLQQQTGGPLIWLKRDDLTGATLTGNKVRKLEFIVARAIANGYGALITCGGIQSNHCRATALVAAQLGLQCHLLLRGEHRSEETSEGNLLLDQLCNASISFHPAKEYFKNIDQLFETKVKGYAENGVKALPIPTGGSNGVGVWGYIAASDELQQNFAEHSIQPTAILCATGSGGTQAGLTVGAELFDLGAAVYGINVCDDEAWFLRKVSNDISQWQDGYPETARLLSGKKPDIRVIDGYVGEGYGKASEAVLATIRKLAALEGVVLDPVYSGKAFDGLLREIDNGRFADSRDICFIHTGGIFGVFPFASQF